MNTDNQGKPRRLPPIFLMVLSETLLWLTKPSRETEPKGSFLLPKALAPFFYPAICASIILTAVVGDSLAAPPDPGTHAAAMQGESALKRIAYKAVTLDPRFLVSATVGALFTTPILYFASGGVSMLANYLKRKEHEARNPETVVKLKEAQTLLEEQQQALAKKDEVLAQKEKALAQKDEAFAKLQQENKELREQLGLNGDHC